ncbi:MAG: Ig-like domain-containing protein, partial [Solobacterium sp.]|nr:Ig-like domain-containing protein [Solobacterium sp.]
MSNRLYSFFLLYLSVLLSFTILTPIQATNDAQGPIMESISIEKEVYTKGETIVITVVASDESGINENTLLAQFNSGGTSKDRVFYFGHVEGNTYIGKLTVDENWVNGTYHLGLLSGKDIYGNWGHKGNLAASFQIVGCRSDRKAPIIDSLTTDKTTYGVGETITLTMVAHDDSGIDVNSMSSMFNITGSSGDHTFYFEEVAENTYEGKLVVGESWQKGTYHMALTYIADIYGNWNTRHEIETSFVVNSEIKDLEGPKILSLIADKEEYSIGDTIELTLRAEDKSGISEADMAAQFNVYGLNKDRIFTFNKVDEGVYKASAITDDTWLVGTYNLGWLSVLDIYHNRANTIDVETSFVLNDKEIEEYPVERIEFNTDELSLLVGEEAQMEVVFFPTNASNQELIWESSNREIVKVENGKVKAISSGEVIVKAISHNGKEAIC